MHNLPSFFNKKIILKPYYNYVLILLLSTCFCSCQTYKQNILVRSEGIADQQKIIEAVSEAESNYKIRKNDYLKIDVYTNKGERILDPNYELTQATQINRIIPQYLVQNEGIVNLPIIGNIQLEGLTLYEAGKLLEERYSLFYKDAYVLINFNNKRVTVLGAPGGQVIPLQNEDMNLFEVLALAGGLDNNAKAGNIRIIRGDINNPRIFVVDLTSVQGLKRFDMKIQPGDIIYVEPVRRVFIEAVRDVAPVLSVVSSVLTLLLVVQQINK